MFTFTQFHNEITRLVNAISSGGGGGGSSVAWTQHVTEGENIATITINGEDTEVYAPTGSGGGGEPYSSDVLFTNGFKSSIDLSNYIDVYDSFLFMYGKTTDDCMNTFIMDKTTLKEFGDVGKLILVHTDVEYCKYRIGTDYVLTRTVGTNNFSVMNVVGIKYGSSGGGGSSTTTELWSGNSSSGVITLSQSLLDFNTLCFVYSHPNEANTHRVSNYYPVEELKYLKLTNSKLSVTGYGERFLQIQVDTTTQLSILGGNQCTLLRIYGIT